LQFSAALAENSEVSLLGAVSGDEIRAAQIVTGLTMAAFIAVGLAPGLRERAGAIRGALLALYLLCCGLFIGYALLR
jgi:hypothetical protein